MQNPSLIEMMAQARTADPSRDAPRRAATHAMHPRRSGRAPTVSSRTAGGMTRLVALRRALGWSLISAGLRLTGSTPHAWPSR